MSNETFMDEVNFLSLALNQDRSHWTQDGLGQLARLQVPELLFGGRRLLLRADIHEQWAWWFVESLADPRYYARCDARYPRIFQDLNCVVQVRFRHLSQQARRQVASTAARIVSRLVMRLRQRAPRRRLSRDEKARLLDLAGDNLRCWICGSKFKEAAVENFRAQESREIPAPPYLDVLKPRGLSSRDFAIEADHVVPYSRGGGDDEENLALACGWCNRHKSACRAIYDVDGRPRTVDGDGLAVLTLPRPFWTVRVLGTIRTCEAEGCGRSADNAAITVAPLCEHGALNPMNMRVTCYDHDPYGELRYQPFETVREMWKGRGRELA